MPLACGCLFALVAASFPRLALLFTWYSPLVTRAFYGGSLCHSSASCSCPSPRCVRARVAARRRADGWGWFWVILGFLLDFGSLVERLCNRSRMPACRHACVLTSLHGRRSLAWMRTTVVARH